MSATFLRSRGFAIPLALFVLVAAAALAAGLLLLSTTQQTSTAIDLQSARVYQAARAGLEWGINHALNPPTGDCAFVDNGGLGTSISPPALPGYIVTVRCTSYPQSEAGVALTVFEVLATGCNQGASCPAAAPATATYVERQLRAVVGSN